MVVGPAHPADSAVDSQNVFFTSLIKIYTILYILKSFSFTNEVICYRFYFVDLWISLETFFFNILCWKCNLENKVWIEETKKNKKEREEWREEDIL